MERRIPLLLGIAALLFGGAWLLRGGAGDGPTSGIAPTLQHPPAAGPSVPPPLPPAPPPPQPWAPLPTTGDLVGRILSSDGRNPPDGRVLLMLTHPSLGKGELVYTLVVERDGHFRCAGLLPGEYTIATRNAEDGPGDDPWRFEHGKVRVLPGTSSSVEIRIERAPEDATGIDVQGSVKYDDGRPVGDFQFSLLGDNENYRVRGEAGVFRRRLPRAGTYNLFWEKADGESRRGGFQTIDVVAGEEVALVIPAFRQFSLVVVDRQTGSPLGAARAYRAIREEDDFVFDAHPNPATLAGTPLRTDEQGRVNLGRGADPEDFFVTADAHEWCKIEVERTPAGELRVALDPGGSVRLSIPGWTRLEDPKLHASHAVPYRGWNLPGPGGDGTLRIEGLPPGKWKFEVTRGWSFQRGETYGTGEVEIVAGVEAALTIETNAPEALQPVPVTGTLSIPVSWGLRRSSVRFKGADASNKNVKRRVSVELPVDGKPARFTIDPVPPGRYDVDIDPQTYETVTVPVEGGNFDLVVPPPGTIVVRVLDDATGAAVESSSVLWHVVAGRSGYGLDRAKPGSSPGEFRILAPEGAVALSVEAKGFVTYRSGTLLDFLASEPGERPKRVVAKAGEEVEVPVRLRRACSVRVVFRWEGEAPNWNDADVTVWSGDEGRSRTGHGMSLKAGVGVVDDIAPGKLRLELRGQFVDFEEVEGRDFEAKAGETVELEVPLVRRR